MKRKLLLVNLALLALVAGVSWRLRQQWIEGKAREGRVLHASVRQTLPRPAPPSPAPKPPAAASYGEIAQEMLFSEDRNPDVVVKVEPPKPLPSLPAAHGVIDFGDGPMVILSLKPGGPHRSFSPGDAVGDFKLLAVSADEIVLDFEGRQLKKKLSELVEKTETKGETTSSGSSSSAARASARTASASPAPARVETPTVREGPGAVMTGQVRACVPGDSAPPGAIVNGLRKVVSETPFGKVCRWEPVN